MVFFWRRRHPISDEDLSAYVDGRLEDAARARLEAHIEACAPCREALEELRAIRQALRELPVAAAPRSFALREADVRPAAVARPPGLVGWASPALSGVAVFAFLAFGVLVGVDLATEPSGAGDAAEMRSTAYGALTEEEAAEAASAQPDVEADGLPRYAGDAREADGGVEGTPELGLLASGPETEEPPSASPAPSPAATRGTGTGVAAEDDGRTRLRAAEAATAAVALVAGGSLALVWWRRRA